MRAWLSSAFFSTASLSGLLFIAASLESGARPPLSHRSPPLRSDVLDTAASSNHENTAIGSESR